MKIGLYSLLFLVGTVTAVKREEFTSSNVANPNTNPVYSPVSGSSVVGGGYSSSSGSGDHQASASSNNYQSISPSGNSHGATYYYYYPQQDKPKDSSVNYQAASSNQYASAVTPNQGDRNVGLEPAGASTDLSYSQDMSNYNGPAIGSGLNEGAPYGGQAAGSGYEGSGLSLSNLAAQYGLAGSSSPGSFNPAAAYPGTGSGPNTYPGAGAYESNAAESGYPGNGPISGFGSQGSPLAFLPQGPFGSYGQHFGNYAAGSSQSPSYEPSTSSGFRKYSLGSIVMPLLALAGLSLLIPTVTSLTGLAASSAAAATSRREKRSVDGGDGIGDYIDRLDRYYSLYKSAVDNEECMNRIICQLGDVVSDVRGKTTFFTILEKVAPSWMGNKLTVFKKGALSVDYEKCKQYKC